MKVEIKTTPNEISKQIILAIEGARFAKKSLDKSDSDDSSYETAIVGINDLELAMKLANTPNASGHDKFLQQIHLIVDITWSRYIWQEFDTYRIGISKQSESTMHTITKDNLSIDDFDLDEFKFSSVEIREQIKTKIEQYIHFINELKQDTRLSDKDFRDIIKNTLPESFMQKRRVSLNYANLKTMKSQRYKHRNPEWTVFLDYMRDNTMFPSLWMGE